MRRFLITMLAGVALFVAQSCSGSSGGDNGEVDGEIAGEAVEATGELPADVPADVPEEDDTAMIDEASDLDIEDADVPPEIEELEVKPPDVVEIEEDEYVAPPPTDVGKECMDNSDCATDAGCLLGFCTAFCKTPGGTVIGGVCENSFPESPWGDMFGCPEDGDVCMPGVVDGLPLTCKADADCEAAGLPGYVCGGAFGSEGEVEVAGRCLPLADRKPAGAACQKGDGSVCGSLFCLHPWMDQGEPGLCSPYCSADTQCPAGSICSMFPVYNDSDDLSGYAPLCVPVAGSLKDCQLTFDCKQGKEFCGAVVLPGTYETKRVCMESANQQGGWLGDQCSTSDQCFGPFCAFGPWANKVNAYCTHPCVSDDDCEPPISECRTVHYASFEDISPDGAFALQVCTKVSQGASCFVAEENVCKYDWSACVPIPGGYGWLGTCEDGTCPPSCEGKACKDDDGCGTACLDACFADGEACADGAECLSGFCVDGVCCKTICDGTCQTCAAEGFLGTCAPMTVNTDPDGECGACNRCNGTGGCKPLPVGDDAQDECPMCLTCDGQGTCLPVTAGADPKADCSECNVCDGAGGCAPVLVGEDPKSDCEESLPETCGTTGTCSGAGACEYWPGDVPCSGSKCTVATYFASSLCNGAGGCVPQGGTPCNPYVCNADETDCLQSCVENKQCVANHWCLGGICEPLPACPMETKLLCNTQLPGTTFGLQNNWAAYDSCVPAVSYSGPERVYSVKLDKTTQITATITDQTFDVAMFLLDTACSPSAACKLYGDEFQAGGPETVQFLAQAGVTYHLAVDGLADAEKGNFKIATQCCTLSCAAESACGDDGCGGSCGNCVADSLCYSGQCHVCSADPGGGVNDTCATAFPLAAGDYKAMLLCPDGDVDWYEVELKEGERLVADVLFENTVINVDASLYAPDCGSLVADSMSLDADEHIDFTAITPGKYKLFVYSPLFQQGGYDLSLKVTPPACLVDKDCPFGKVCGLYKCLTPPAACQTAGELACFSFLDGQLAEGAGKFDAYTTCTGLTFVGPEAIYSVKLDAETVVSATLLNQQFQGQIAVMEKYCASTWACVAAAQTPGPGMGVQIQFKAKPQTQYYVVVDGSSSADFGPFALTSDCCLPQCDGKVCGPDGCGMTCGECPGAQDACVEGACVCQPSCGGKVCGDDGCGGSCGDCTGLQDACVDGQCACQPACTDKVCGDDGCGGICGTCPGPQDACIEGACVCQPDCNGKVCGDDGCGGSCGACPGVQDECLLGQCLCKPMCDGKACGDDGCGGSCGTCPGVQDACVNFQCLCQPACAGKKCGDDGCGGVCGTCSQVEYCEASQCKCQSDGGFEPNDTCAKATPLGPGSYPNLGICSGNDQDMYAITLLPNQTLTAQILFSHKLGDLDLFLRKQGACNSYLKSSSSTQDNEQIVYTTQVQSTFVIHVSPLNGLVSNSYTLVVGVN